MFWYFDANVSRIKLDKWLLIDAARSLIKGFSVVEKLKLLDNYVYQSCEHDEWKESNAKKVIDACYSKLIPMLEDYDDAEWGIE